MMTFRKISAACRGQIISNYYLQDIPDPESDCRLDPTKTPDSDGARLTNYYTGRDGRASWRPDMPWRAAEALGIDRFKSPTREQLSRLYEAKRADNGEEWSAHQRKISAYDLTLAPYKSVTLAAEFAETDAERAAIWHAMQIANDETMRYVARELGLARRGRGGKDGAEEGHVTWVTYRHTTARPTVDAEISRKGCTSGQIMKKSVLHKRIFHKHKKTRCRHSVAQARMIFQPPVDGVLWPVLTGVA